MQPNPRTSKGALPLYRNPLEIDFDPLRFDIAEQSSLSNSSCTCCLLVDAQTSSRIHLPEVRHNALPRTSRGAIALDQSPVAVPLALLLAIAAAQVHASMLQITSLLSSGLVFTTNGFAQATQQASSRRGANRKLRNLEPQIVSEMCSKNFQTTPNCGSWARASWREIFSKKAKNLLQERKGTKTTTKKGDILIEVRKGTFKKSFDRKRLTGPTLLSRWEKRGRGGTEDETVKLLNGIQRV